MIPKFLGDPSAPLFGVYHPPTVERRRAFAVLLCYPAHQEYRLVHWTFRKLAELLAAEGFHVLRFDYSSFGDSAGESADADLDRWVDDIGTAAAELGDLSGLPRLSLVGMRVGAVLAARAAAKGVAGGIRVRDLVLWEPVVSGREYLAQLERDQARLLLDLPYPHDIRRDRHELLGFPMPPRLRAQTESLDLLAVPAPDVEHVIVFSAEDRPEHAALDAHPPFASRVYRRHVVPDATLSLRADTWLAHRILQAIVGHFTQRVA